MTKSLSGSELIGILTSRVVRIDLGERSNVVELALGGVFPAVSGSGHIDRVLGWLMRRSGETEIRIQRMFGGANSRGFKSRTSVCDCLYESQLKALLLFASHPKTTSSHTFIDHHYGMSLTTATALQAERQEEALARTPTIWIPANGVRSALFSLCRPVDRIKSWARPS